MFILQNTTFRRLDYLCLQVKPFLRTEIETSFVDWAQLSRFYLKTETESSLRNVMFCNINITVFLDKDKTMANVQNIIFVLMSHRHKLLDLMIYAVKKNGSKIARYVKNISSCKNHTSLI
jgi:hypothetical protein